MFFLTIIPFLDKIFFARFLTLGSMSFKEKITFFTPDLIIKFVQGGVLPKCTQGSKVE